MEEAEAAIAEAQQLNIQGQQAWQSGDLETAERALSRALPLILQYAPDSSVAAFSLYITGKLLYERGKLGLARQHFQRSLTLREKINPKSLDVADSLNNLGIIAADQGDYETAHDCFSHSLSLIRLLEPNSLRLARNLNNVGGWAYLRRDFQTALNLFLDALHLREEQLPPDSLDVADSLNNIGLVYTEWKDMSRAREYHSRALTIRANRVPETLVHAVSLCNLGLASLEEELLTDAKALLVREGFLAEAQKLHVQADAIRARLAPYSIDRANSQEALGRIAFRRGEFACAVEHFEQSVANIEQARAEITSPDVRARLLETHANKFGGLIHSYRMQGDSETAFSALERARARSMLEMLTDRDLDVTQDAPPDLLRRQQALDARLEETSSELTSLAVNSEEATRIEELHLKMHTLTRQREELVAQIRAASPRYAALQYPQPLSCQAVQQLLKPGMLLLSYFVDEEQTLLFALIREQPPVIFPLPFSREVLRQRVRLFVRSLNPELDEHDADDMASQSQRLYNDLIQPAQALVQDATRLLICPDGPLLTLPFGALTTNSDQQSRYLGEEKPLHTILSATLYAHLQATNQETKETAWEQPTASPTQESVPAQTAYPDSASLSPAVWRLLAVGDPLYTASAFEPLPHTREEALTLAALFGESTVLLLGAEATKTAVLRESVYADLLHFACHGWFNPQIPLHSGLVLSHMEALEATIPPESTGLLPAWEIFQKLRLQARLVVLSACRTGQGQEMWGEGLIGLARAFQYAGAKSLVATLWDIADKSTSLFMQAFYTTLKNGTTTDEALRQAIRTLREHSRWQHPFYWAAFVLIGNGE